MKVGSITSLPPNSLQEVMVGDDCYALCNVDGQVYAMAGLCLHRNGPLAEGALHGATVVCPWHAWEWDCRSGASTHDPTRKMETFPVKMEGEDILIDIP